VLRELADMTLIVWRGTRKVDVIVSPRTFSGQMRRTQIQV